METNPSSPVSPRVATDLTIGLTKREHFAALALSGILANPETEKTAEALNENYQDYAADTAVKCADALIRSLNATGAR